MCLLERILLSMLLAVLFGLPRTATAASPEQASPSAADAHAASEQAALDAVAGKAAQQAALAAVNGAEKGLHQLEIDNGLWISHVALIWTNDTGRLLVAREDLRQAYEKTFYYSLPRAYREPIYALREKITRLQVQLELQVAEPGIVDPPSETIQEAVKAVAPWSRATEGGDLKTARLKVDALLAEARAAGLRPAQNTIGEESVRRYYLEEPSAKQNQSKCRWADPHHPPTPDPLPRWGDAPNQ